MKPKKIKQQYEPSRLRGLTKGNAAALEALGVDPLPIGVRPTKAMRFTLPTALADKLESLPKQERDNLLKSFLESLL
jgi:hypothetical protein